MAPHRPGNPQQFAAGPANRAGPGAHLQLPSSPPAPQPPGPGPHPSRAGHQCGRSVSGEPASRLQETKSHASMDIVPIVSQLVADVRAHHRFPRSPGRSPAALRLAGQLSCAPRGEPPQLGTIRCRSRHRRAGPAHGSCSPHRLHRRHRPALQLACHLQAAATRTSTPCARDRRCFSATLRSKSSRLVLRPRALSIPSSSSSCTPGDRPPICWSAASVLYF